MWKLSALGPSGSQLRMVGSFPAESPQPAVSGNVRSMLGHDDFSFHFPKNHLRHLCPDTDNIKIKLYIDETSQIKFELCVLFDQ